MFGDPAEPYHHEALALTVQTEEAVTAVLWRDERTTAQDAAALAHIVSAIMFISMAATINAANPVDAVVQEINDQVRVLLAGDAARRSTARADHHRQSLRLTDPLAVDVQP